MGQAGSIAIVGGGLAGLATAHALGTFGFAAEVFEAAPLLGEIGAGINTSPQAVKALRAIGLGDRIAAIGNTSQGTYTRNMQTGEPLEFRDRWVAAARYGAPYYTFHRADLMDALASGLDPACIHLDHRLTGIEERPSGVVLHFSNGATHQADFVIAADGINSVVRRTLYGADNPSYTGQMVWRSLLNGSDVPREIMEPSGHIQWLGPGCHFLAYYLRGTDVVNIVTQEDPTNGSRKAGRRRAIPTRCGAAFPIPSHGSKSS